MGVETSIEMDANTPLGSTNQRRDGDGRTPHNNNSSRNSSQTPINQCVQDYPLLLPHEQQQKEPEQRRLGMRSPHRGQTSTTSHLKSERTRGEAFPMTVKSPQHPNTQQRHAGMMVPLPPSRSPPTGAFLVAEKTELTKEDITQMIKDNPLRRLAVINGNVYDTTSLASTHPGGSEVIHSNNGKDATEPFESMHGSRARRVLDGMYIGKFAKGEKWQNGVAPAKDTTSSTDEITPAELERRIQADPRRLLLVLFGDVYDATSFASQHPGGVRVLASNVGRECGKSFMSIHGRRGKEMVKDFYIGHLKGAPVGQSPLRRTVEASPVASMNENMHSTRLLDVKLSSSSSQIRYFTFSCAEPLKMIPGGHIKLFSNPTEERGKYYTPYACGVASFSICMKHYDKGETSSYFFLLEEGTEVFYEGPFPPAWIAAQDRYLQKNDVSSSRKHVVLMAGGTGAAPLYSIANDLLTRQVANVTLVCSIQTHSDIVLGGEMKQLMARYRDPVCDGRKRDPNACYGVLIFVLSRSPPDMKVAWASATYTGHVHARMLINAKVAPADAAVLCGPPSFNEAARSSVIEARICKKDQVHAL